MNPRIIAVLFLLATGSVRFGLAEDKKMWAKSMLGQPAPELQVEKWLTQKPETQGKFVLIDFWATWCRPCRQAIPELNYWQKKYAGKLIVIGLSDESEETVRGMKAPAIEYASAVDTQARTKKALEVTGFPHVILMDPHGIVRWEGLPSLDDHELTDEVIDDLLAKYSK